MNFLLRFFPAYILMESALIASRREAEDLRAELSSAHLTIGEWRSRYEEDRAELKEIRRERIEELRQTANFMAYAKTARMIFVEPGSNLPQPAPQVTPEQLGGRSSMRDKVAQARREFDEEIRKASGLPEQDAA